MIARKMSYVLLVLCNCLYLQLGCSAAAIDGNSNNYEDKYFLQPDSDLGHDNITQLSSIASVTGGVLISMLLFIVLVVVCLFHSKRDKSQKTWHEEIHKSVVAMENTASIVNAARASKALGDAETIPEDIYTTEQQAALSGVMNLSGNHVSGSAYTDRKAAGLVLEDSGLYEDMKTSTDHDLYESMDTANAAANSRARRLPPPGSSGSNSASHLAAIHLDMNHDSTTDELYESMDAPPGAVRPRLAAGAEEAGGMYEVVTNPSEHSQQAPPPRPASKSNSVRSAALSAEEGTYMAYTGGVVGEVGPPPSVPTTRKPGRQRAPSPPRSPGVQAEAAEDNLYVAVDQPAELTNRADALAFASANPGSKKPVAAEPIGSYEQANGPMPMPRTASGGASSAGGGEVYLAMSMPPAQSTPPPSRAARSSAYCNVNIVGKSGEAQQRYSNIPVASTSTIGSAGRAQEDNGLYEDMDRMDTLPRPARGVTATAAGSQQPVYEDLSEGRRTLSNGSTGSGSRQAWAAPAAAEDSGAYQQLLPLGSAAAAAHAAKRSTAAVPTTPAVTPASGQLSSSGSMTRRPYENLVAGDEEGVPADPADWTSLQCQRWLRLNGFADFVDVFYAQGFEGWQMLNLRVDKLTRLSSFTTERCMALIKYIEQTLIKINDQLANAGPVAAQNSPQVRRSVSRLVHPAVNQAKSSPPSRRSQVAPATVAAASSATLSAARRSSSGGGGVVGGSAMLKELPDTEIVEAARLKYMLTLKISGRDGEKLLHVDGEYLIRRSANTPDAYVLCMYGDGRLHNYQIKFKQEERYYFTNKGHKFRTLDELVKYFKEHQDGTPCLLTHLPRCYDDKLEMRARAPYENTDFVGTHLLSGQPTVGSKARPYENIAPPSF